MPISGIYGLQCPHSGDIRYIGQSKDIDRRYKEHCRLSNNLSERRLCRWMRGLISEHTLPSVVVLEETEYLDDAEMRHIAAHHGDLLNMNAGGADYSHMTRAKLGMPWGKRQAPIQKAMIAARRIAKEANNRPLMDKLDKVQLKLKRIKKDPCEWIVANLLFVQSRPAFKTWNKPIQVGDNWY